MPMCTEQELLEFMRETAYKPMTYQELEKHFGIDNADDFKTFLRMLTELEHEGKVLLTHTGRYGVPERMNLLRGRLQAHPKGFAFLLPDEPDHPDVYIHANDMKGAMNGDVVLVRVTSKSENGQRMEGEIVRIVKRAITQVVGLFENHESYGFVIPDDKRINKDIFIPLTAFSGAVTGQKVVVNIVRYPEGRSAAEGEIVEVLGHKDDPGVDILSIIRKHGLPESFPDDVMEEAEAAPDAITEEEIVRQGRRDLRDRVIVTIDGEDAKDLDDAVNVERLENGNLLLGVHIADVSYYVREKSKLDEEAYNRGCSVYLVDRVIPMLPHRLSNGICSLNPQVDRMTMSCEMEFDPRTMKRVRHDVFTSVIRTRERMTYTNVRKIVQNEDPEVMERYADLVDNFRLMEELAMALRSQRMRRGAIDFDFEESKVIVDKHGKAVDIVKRERSVAEQIIEEFMLAANETVAEHFHLLKVPFLYRIHEDPDSEKLMHFMQFAGNFGYVVQGKGNSVHPRALQTLLEQIRDTKEETVISTMMLRSMKQAKYDAESLGHFGLAAEFYTHFTSPIRRYPDLIVHRVMREVLENGGAMPESRVEALAPRMADIAQQSSERERVAVEAERDTAKLKKAEFMLDKIGEEFSGMISGVTSFGMFVELDNTVEGLIRLSDLTDDYYHFHELQMALIGERTSKIYRIGDEVKIRVARVNMDDYNIDFEMVDMKPRSAGRARWVDARGAGSGGGFDRKRKKKRGAGGGFVAPAAAAGPGRRGGGAAGGRGGAGGGERGGGAGAGGGERAGAGGGERGGAGGGERGGAGGGERGGGERGGAAGGGERGGAGGGERGGAAGKGRRGGKGVDGAGAAAAAMTAAVSGGDAGSAAQRGQAGSGAEGSRDEQGGGAAGGEGRRGGKGRASQAAAAMSTAVSGGDAGSAAQRVQAGGGSEGSRDEQGGGTAGGEGRRGGKGGASRAVAPMSAAVSGGDAGSVTQRVQAGGRGKKASVAPMSREEALAAARPKKRAGSLDMWGLPVSGQGLKDDGGEKEALAEMRKSARRSGMRRQGGSDGPAGGKPPGKRGKSKE